MAQAFLFINGDLLNRKVTADGGMVDRLLKANKSDSDILDELYWTTFGRAPNAKERASNLQALERAIAATPKDPTSRRHALEDMLWVLVNSKEFLFNH